MLDLVLCALPKHGVNVPPLALPYLAGFIRRSGYSIEVMDLNLDLWKRTRDLPAWHHIWMETDTTLYAEPHFSKFRALLFDPILEKWVDEILSFEARYVGLSCFSYRCLPTLKEVVRILKSKKHDVKIIVGGAPINSYAEKLIDEMGVTYAVKSEGEFALVEILKGNFTYPGIVSAERRKTDAIQIENLDEVSFPDYKGIDVGEYTPGDPGGLKALKYYETGRLQAGIMSSRGCVRACRFCDVASWWPKFRWRSAENIFAEMESLYNTSGVDEFYFHDSLINGSLTHLEKLLDILIENRSRLPFKLKGLTIIRNQPEKLYEKMAQAGFVQLQIGIESFSERLRDIMNKRFSNALLEENLNNYAKHGLEVILLLMSGYPAELESDHHENLRWIEEKFHFFNKPVKRLDFGGTMLILPGAPVFAENDEKFFIDSNGNWMTFNSEGANTYSLRIRRMLEGENLAKKMGWVIGTSYSDGANLIGDVEKLALDGRPQDLFRKLDFQDDIGWMQDPTRAIVGFQN